MSVPTWPTNRRTSSPETPIETTGIQSIEVNSYSGNVRRLSLANDEDSPGGNKFYGTDTDGNKGWQDTNTSILGITTQAGSYTLALEDVGSFILTNTSDANNITIPPHSSVPFIIGTTILVFQYGTGQTTFVPGVGVTTRSQSGNLSLIDQYTGATLIKINTDEWVLIGNLI